MLAFVLLFGGGFVVLNLASGIGGNFGLPFGYYGEANLVISRLRDIDDVRILGVRYHKDTILEDFWVKVSVNDEPARELFFSPQNQSMEEMIANVERFNALVTGSQ